MENKKSFRLPSVLVIQKAKQVSLHTDNGTPSRVPSRLHTDNGTPSRVPSRAVYKRRLGGSYSDYLAAARCTAFRSTRPGYEIESFSSRIYKRRLGGSYSDYLAAARYTVLRSTSRAMKSNQTLIWQYNFILEFLLERFTKSDR